MRQAASRFNENAVPRWGLLRKLAEASGVPGCAAQPCRQRERRVSYCMARCSQQDWPRKEKHRILAPAEVEGTIAQLCKQQRAERQTGTTRGHRGQWKLPSRHEDILLAQLRAGAERGWWKEYSPGEAEEQLGSYLAWLYFGVVQQKSSGEWTVRGCLAADGINSISGHCETLYMAGVDGVAELGRALRNAIGEQVKLRMASEDWRTGYFQLQAHSSSAKLLCATAWDPLYGIRCMESASSNQSVPLSGQPTLRRNFVVSLPAQVLKQSIFS